MIRLKNIGGDGEFSIINEENFTFADIEVNLLQPENFLQNMRNVS